MTASAAAVHPRRSGWTNHIANDQLREAGGLDPKARAYILAADSLRKDRPFVAARADEFVELLGIRGKTAAARRRTLQRLEARLEAEGTIRRVLVHGRTDLVSGRQTVTGRIGIIPLRSFSKLPYAQSEAEADQVEAELREGGGKRARTLPFPPIGARQICAPTAPSCTTNLTAPYSPTGSLDPVTTTTYGGPSSSSLMASGPKTPQPAEPSQPSTPVPAADHEEPWPGLTLAMAAFIATLGIRMTDGGDRRPLTGDLADQLVGELVRVHGLRRVAWVIVEAARRRRLGKPIRVSRWFRTTLENWQRGDGWSSDDPRAISWPDEFRPKPAAPPPAAEASPEPPDRDELEATIREVEGMLRPSPFDQVRRKHALAELARIDAAGRSSS